MSVVRSFGIIPFRRVGDDLEFLLIQHAKGNHWGFPKGRFDHVDETPRQAAQRELREETGLTIRDWILTKPFVESYEFFREQKKISKTVTYFLAEVEGELKLQVEEIRDGRWVKMDEVLRLLSFDAQRNLFAEAVKKLTGKRIKFEVSNSPTKRRPRHP